VEPNPARAVPAAAASGATRGLPAFRAVPHNGLFGYGALQAGIFATNYCEWPTPLEQWEHQVGDIARSFADDGGKTATKRSISSAVVVRPKRDAQGPVSVFCRHPHRQENVAWLEGASGAGRSR